MQQAITGEFEVFDASKWRIGIVTAQFNSVVTSSLEKSALKRAKDYQIPDSSIDVVKVAGAVELPLALQHMAKSGKYDVLLAIGCVIRGATPHFEYVCQFATQGILRVQLDNNIAIGFGVLTCEDEAQAKERANLGNEHLDAALQLAKLING